MDAGNRGFGALRAHHLRRFHKSRSFGPRLEVVGANDRYRTALPPFLCPKRGILGVSHGRFSFRAHLSRNVIAAQSAQAAASSSGNTICCSIFTAARQTTPESRQKLAFLCPFTSNFEGNSQSFRCAFDRSTVERIA